MDDLPDPEAPMTPINDDEAVFQGDGTELIVGMQSFEAFGAFPLREALHLQLECCRKFCGSRTASGQHVGVSGLTASTKMPPSRRTR